MNPIIFKLETVTPMFLAGEDGKTFELRPPTIKGLIRYWWRAQYWGKQLELIDKSVIEKKEGQLFGTAAKNGYKSPFSIRLIFKNQLRSIDEPFPKQNIPVTSRGRTFRINILEYLAYGTYEYHKGKGNIFARQYLDPRQKFNVHLMFGEECGIETIKEVVKSFYCMSLFGGIGAKSRNGFGSFSVTNPQDNFTKFGLSYPIKDMRYVDEITKNNERPNYSAFSNKAIIFELKNRYDTWHECLANIGIIYRNARSNLERKHQYEKRQFIGAPIVAFKTYKSLLDRRSKPYFMKVHKVGEKFKGSILYLPSSYCYGKNEDRNGNPLPQDIDEKFSRVCDQFNKNLEYEIGGIS